MFASGKTGNPCQQKTSQQKTTATIRQWGCFCHVSVHAFRTVFHNPTLFATGLLAAGGVRLHRLRLLQGVIHLLRSQRGGGGGQKIRPKCECSKGGCVNLVL